MKTSRLLGQNGEVPPEGSRELHPRPVRTERLANVLIVLAVLSFAGYLFLPRDGGPRGGAAPGDQITILHPDLVNLMDWLLPAGGLLFGAASLLLALRRRFVSGYGVFLVGLFSFLITGGMGGWVHGARWTMCDRLTTENGTQYCFVDSSFLQGHTLALGRIEREDRFSHEVRIVGSTTGDSPRTHLLVVRPLPLRPVDHGALYGSRTGLIAGMRYRNQCCFVYDIKEQKFYPREELAQFSPYLLHDATSSLHAPDEAEIARELNEPPSVGGPSTRAIRESLSHDNAAVRESAARLLGWGVPKPR